MRTLRHGYGAFAEISGRKTIMELPRWDRVSPGHGGGVAIQAQRIPPCPRGGARRGSAAGRTPQPLKRWAVLSHPTSLGGTPAAQAPQGNADALMILLQVALPHRFEYPSRGRNQAKGKATMSAWWGRRWWGQSVAVAAIGGGMLVGLTAKALAQTFPYGTELLLDANPIRGSKKIPSLDIGQDGTADIDLWCNAVKARLVVAANTITIITGEMSMRQCLPERARADQELLAALNDVTTWRMEREALVFTGSRTLRFRVQTN
jgi:heat shock protein HslJ